MEGAGMTPEAFMEKLKGALIVDITPRMERLPHIKDGAVFKVIKELKSISIIDFVAPEFEIFKAHMVLEFRFKVKIDFVYFTGDMKANNWEQQEATSKECFGSCRYLAEQEWLSFELERIRF